MTTNVNNLPHPGQRPITHTTRSGISSAAVGGGVIIPPAMRPTIQSLFISACIALTGVTASAAPTHDIVRKFCIDCHDADAKKGGIDLDSILSDDITRHTATWEKVVRQLNARQMPPIGKKRPDDAGYDQTVAALTAVLDAQPPQPGRTDTLRRLTRAEYQNAIRDLLGIDIDAATLLPADESSHGFDNVTVGDLPPALLERYISAAQKIARMAVGAVASVPGGETIRVRPDITQEEHIEGLPLGTRGGALIRHRFPQDGDYEVQLRLMRDRNEIVEGLNGTHEMEVLLNREVKAAFTIKPPPGRKDYTKVDAGLTARFAVKAGTHDLGVTFIRNGGPLLERLRQPYKASFNFHRHPRLSPALYEVSITGPFDVKNPRAAALDVKAIMRRAYRRPVTNDDLARIQPFLDAGTESAISAILVSRDFLFRTESAPAGLAPGAAYRISNLELASRLSFFLWSSIPDDELLAADLGDANALEKQTRRMLADPRSQSLVTSFADQWLYLRNLDSITPDARLFPDFDHNLREAMRTETQLLFESIAREDRSVLELLRTDRTWLNGRLAQHYGIPHIYGARFREVKLDAQSNRGGLMRHGSILTVTSYATRTSPVIRGHWVLKNLIGSPPPPPPPDVPALDGVISDTLPIRERLAQHRANAACASCHNLMDPIGFALENYDALGRWRAMSDVTGSTPDGTSFSGVDGLEQALLKRPDLFVSTMTEKLLTYALGRGIEPHDAPAVREIVRSSAKKDHRFSEIITALVKSAPFTMRSTP